MNRFLFACAAGILSAAAAAAQSPAPAMPAPYVPAPPVMYGGSSTTMGTTAMTTSTRRGLFGRLRGDRASMSAPVMASPVTMPFPSGGTVITTPGTGGVMPGTVVPAPMPSTGTAVPMPMPAVAPRPVPMSSAMPAVTGAPIVLAGGTGPGMVTTAGGTAMPGMVMPAGGVVTTGGIVMPASGMMVMPNPCGTTGPVMVPMPAPVMTMRVSSTVVTGRTGMFGRARR